MQDLVDKAYADKSADELAAAPLTALKGVVGSAKAAALTTALAVHTVAELARNPIVLATQTIVAATGSD